MKVPLDASLDVQAFAKEVIAELNRLGKSYVQVDGSRMIGAGDADTQLGLVTLRQLTATENRASNDIADIRALIQALKDKNGLK